MALHLSEELAFTTVRLEGITAARKVSTGTGFFYRTDVNANEWIPSIITNKHVLKNVRALSFHVSLMGADREPIIGRYHTINVPDIRSSVILHPNPAVDLAAIPCSGLVNIVESTGDRLFLKFFNRSHIPTPTDEGEFGAIEPILMVGYPNGLWDAKHNRPLMRRGITATHPSLDLNDKGEFLIDAACFPGSSGSPVILWREPGHIDRRGNLNLTGIDPKLLGILFAGPTMSVEGKIVVKPIPTRSAPIPETRMPINLGYVVKARYLIDLEHLIIENLPRAA